MSGGGKLYVGEIDCLVLRQLVEVRWLGVLRATNCLTFHSRSESGASSWTLNLRSVWHTLACNLCSYCQWHLTIWFIFGLSPRIYSLKFLDPLHLSFSLKSPSSSLCGHYCIVYIYLRSRNNSLRDIVNLLIKISSRDWWVKQYIQNLQIRFSILNPCHLTGQRCKFKRQFCLTN